MKIGLDNIVLVIASFALTSCSLNSKKLGYESEDEMIESQIQDTQGCDTAAVIDDLGEDDTVVAIDEDITAVRDQHETNDVILPKVYSDSKFSIRYPSTWEIVQQDARATANTTIAVQIMQKPENDYDFMPNVNVIVSKNKHVESTADLARLSYSQAKDAGFATSLIGVRAYSINGNKGSVAEYTASIEGYKLHIFQYIVKKKDNTTFTITMTLDHSNMRKQQALAQQIIDSIKIL